VTGQTVVVRRILPASCEEVFDAWLDAEGMSEWMRPGPVTSCEVALDPRIGGRFRIVMTAPGAPIVNTGEFRVLDRPVRLQFTWVSSRWENHETLVTVELHPRDAECELVLTHERFPAGYSAKQLAGGWGRMLDQLAGRFAR
jgi:uncharacterized protein YndB with AHSA1/START domain